MSARLAQSVEHGTLNPRVVGSSPTSGAFFYAACFTSPSARFAAFPVSFTRHANSGVANNAFPVLPRNDAAANAE